MSLTGWGWHTSLSILPRFTASSSSVTLASFSTSASQHAQGKKGTKAPVKRKTKLKKTSTGQKPRRRGGDSGAALSKTNPFLETRKDMSFLEEFLPEVATEQNLYNIFAWSKRTLDAVRFPEGFGLSSSLSRQFYDAPRPRTLLRPQSLQVFSALDEAASTSTSSSNTILHAPTGSGTSTLLTQALSYALESGWLVISIPRVLRLVDNSSPYVYSEAQQTYQQPQVAQSLLEKILYVNQDLLGQVALADGAVSLGRSGKIEAGTNLSDVIRQGLTKGATPDTVQTVLEVVLRNIVQQRSVPVLVTFDGLQGLFSTSRYRDADYRPLESYELAVPRALQALLRKEQHSAMGGVQRGLVLGSSSLEHSEWPVPRELASVLPALAPRLIEPYAQVNQTTQSIVEACKFHVWDLVSNLKLSLDEASALLDITRQEGGQWSLTNDEILMTKLVESGGNVSAFDKSVRSSLL